MNIRTAVITDIKVMHYVKWLKVSKDICAKRGGLFLLANAQVLTREMLDARLLHTA
ncbi:hypothetical protein KC887_06965 [Candidatus Kaiserbacteria bacterium]|nr:hypothetical protein [Candidatus Kaiserbacteria bacterium]